MCYICIMFNISGIIFRYFCEESWLRFFLTIIHAGIWIPLRQTIFLPDFIMSQLHFCSPLFLTGLPHTVLPLHLRVFCPVPGSLALAAAQAANKKGDDDDASQHRHGDDQNLEVYPAHPPSCILQGTQTVGGQDVSHRVVDA